MFWQQIFISKNLHVLAKKFWKVFWLKKKFSRPEQILEIFIAKNRK